MKTREDYAKLFYIDDHAVLFALLIKQAVLSGEKGLDAAVKGVILYGKERGLRMAMRCVADGKPLTLRNYLNYGEWVDDRKWSDFRPTAFDPFVMEAFKCGWCSSWQKYGLLEYGRIFCQWIDPSLVKGFNPEVNFSMGDTLSGGGERCRFNFHDATFAGPEDFQSDAAERTTALAQRVRDFLYQTGHVLSAMRRNFLLELGFIVGTRLTDAALKEYAALFGQEKIDVLLEESRQDYLRV